MMRYCAAILAACGLALSVAGCGTAGTTNSLTQTNQDPLVGRWSGNITDPNQQGAAGSGTLTIVVSQPNAAGFYPITATEVTNGGATTFAFTGTIIGPSLVGASAAIGNSTVSTVKGSASLNNNQLSGNYSVTTGSVTGQPIPFTLTMATGAVE